MKIILTPEIALKLHTFARIYTKEFSGFGFIERDGDNLKVYDIVVLDVGSESFTEIPTKKILDLMNRPDADKMKLWYHKHPVNGWSGTDENTIKTAPLGGIPDLVKWSASIVLTPNLGWIGRVDSYKTGKTIIADVVPNYHQWAQTTLDEIIASKPKRVFVPRYQSSQTDEWDNGLEDEWGDDIWEGDEEDEDLSPYEKQVATRNSRLQQSSWFKRWFRK